MTSPSPTLDSRPRAVRELPLGDLLAGISGIGPLSERARSVTVGGLTLDSRSVRPGDVYAALPGESTHGAKFVPEAVAAGAAAVLTDQDGAAALADAADTGVPVVVAPRPRAMLGALAAAAYGRPAEKLLTIGVTGTQGKTTVTYLLEAALRGAGRVPGLVGTTGSRADGRPIASRLTTPEAPDLHALLAVMGERGVDACALEVSSHALVQGRVDGVVFDVAAFLNLGRDHLDFHRDQGDYFAAKADLFTPERARRAVIDVGDTWGRRLAERTTIPYVTCSVAPGVGGDWRAEQVLLSARRSDFTVLAPDGRHSRVRLPLPGTFNVRNALAAVATLVEAGLSLDEVAAGLAHASAVPGRTEPVDVGQGFTAIVDYAHKPDAVQAVLEALRPTTDGRLVVVLGAGGDRDPGKRPLMGRVAARLADVLVVTDDNPRTEDPGAIRAEVLSGVDRTRPYAELFEVPERAAAIAHAVALAGTGDTLVVAGKGHETGQEVAGTVHPFDDREALGAALRESLRDTGHRTGDVS